MTIRKTIGGDRLGSGKRMKTSYKSYERSNHDLSFIWRSTMAPGTLVPFMSMVMLPGDTLDINLDSQVLTYPTTGPLFGQFKMQVDIFEIPIRLYQAALHNNALKIGLDMAQVKLPLLNIKGNNIDWEADQTENPIDLQQFSQSSLLSYLGIRGLGHDEAQDTVEREFNAIPYLAYWDIYKNYYANNQEEIGAFINYTQPANPTLVQFAKISNTGTTTNAPFTPVAGDSLKVVIQNTTFDNVEVHIDGELSLLEGVVSGLISEHEGLNGVVTRYYTINPIHLGRPWESANIINTTVSSPTPQLETFPLENIDTMRELILQKPKTSPFIIDQNTLEPYGDQFKYTSGSGITGQTRSYYPMQGLALKTYQSDIFNNWVNTEWIDGASGVSAVSAIDVSSGLLTMDSLNLAQKVYNMLNRVAVSGGSYYNWIEATYSEEAYRNAETPMYAGGMSKMIHFQQVINTAQSTDNPLGDLGGRGVDGDQKGGNIVIKTKEHSYVIGIISLTPIIDYSQGNNWDTNLKTMNDFHMPEFDAIGFQDNLTDQMAAWDTYFSPMTGNLNFRSVGKVPAWLNYMTNFNKTYGNFADPRSEMFMTLNRRYEADTVNKRIKDLTTYIDPSKFNYAFAVVDRGAQNFWIQLGVKIHARRKMSAKVIPNL